MLVLPFALLPAAFSTFPTWNTLILQLALCLLHSAQFLPGHSPYQLATFSFMVSWWPHSFQQPFPAPSFRTALLFLLLLFTKILFITATFSWPLSLSGKPRLLEEVRIKTIFSNLPLIWSFHSTPTGSAPSSDHSLAALISPRFLQAMPSSSHSIQCIA